MMLPTALNNRHSALRCTGPSVRALGAKLGAIRGGRLRTAMDSEPVGFGRYGRLRTSMDDLRPSTDQKVGDSSSSGRASKACTEKALSRDD